MKTKFKTIQIPFMARLLIYWLLFFALLRLAFIVYYHEKIPDGQYSQTWLSFFYGLRLDVSTACAAVSIPFLLWSLQQFYKNRITHIINLIFNIICISAVSVLNVANLKMYGEWGTLLNKRALGYLLYPKEVLTFIPVWSVVLLSITCGIFIFVGIKIYRRYITNFSFPIENKKLKITYFVITPILLVVGYRGGLQQVPINESSAYYSNLQINNHIATNATWYLAHSIVDAGNNKDSYQYMDAEKAKTITADLYTTTSDKTKNIIKSRQPNIVIIILESWTADLIQVLGGETNITPHFDQLRKEGLLFSQMYSSGFRTDQGLLSILSGFPGQPDHSIINTPSKAEKLPSLTIELGKQGYQSSFYYGGEVEFANMKSYLLNTHFEKIIDKNNFEKEQLNSKWGAHDEYVLMKQLEGLKTEKRPFFPVVLTLSTHEPFEVTMQTPFNGGEEKERFKKAAYYTDYCLYNYFNEAKKQPWYNNALFILVADHGHHLPMDRNMDFPEGHRITAMITGGALADSLRGKIFDKICNQDDIPATILAQLKLPHGNFAWSKDLFNKSVKGFAYYSNENALGWVTPEQNIVYSFNSKKIEELQPKTETKLNDTILIQAKAFLQTLYKQYLDY